jgi:beta-N-acetylhexosaminidase
MIRADLLSLEHLCGQLIVGGFDGETLPARFRDALRARHRAGAILFRRNLSTLEGTRALCAALIEADTDAPPFIAIDEEGGRVGRLPAPYTRLPPMRSLAATSTLQELERVGDQLGSTLASLGFNLDFAPILDVDTNPANPIIGDRAFSADPHEAASRALAFAAGLGRHVLTCGKHFPGHGDTHLDSHLALPVVDHDEARLRAIELVPFAAACPLRVDSMMSAHIVVNALDRGIPATLSRRVCTTLLRDELGFEGLLFSDDLEMKAVADMFPIEESAVRSIEAGCDVLLICKDEDLQDRAHRALVLSCERDSSFRERCVEAATRSLDARYRRPPRVS